MSGKDGELLFQQVMAARGNKVVDVSNNPDYWPLDIDFVITSTLGETKTFEVKWDSRMAATGNLFLEMRNPRSKQWNGDGWWPHCKADYLVYGDAANRIFYCFSLLELRERVKQLNLRYKVTGDFSEGYLLPLAAVVDMAVQIDAEQNRKEKC